jgi:hypothetical protein
MNRWVAVALSIAASTMAWWWLISAIASNSDGALLGAAVGTVGFWAFYFWKRRHRAKPMAADHSTIGPDPRRMR